MRFIPHTEADVAAMLETLGVAHLDDLVAHVPEKLRAIAAINLASGMDEAEVATEVRALAARNSGALVFVSFRVGGGGSGPDGAADTAKTRRGRDLPRALPGLPRNDSDVPERPD